MTDVERETNKLTEMEYASIFEGLQNDIFTDLNLLSYEQSAVKHAAIALREKAERLNPKPLTLEELTERAKSESIIWIKGQNSTILVNCYAISKLNGFEILEYDSFGSEVSGFANLSAYGKTWLAYDHEPKGE